MGAKKRSGAPARSIALGWESSEEASAPTAAPVPGAVRDRGPGGVGLVPPTGADEVPPSPSPGPGPQTPARSWRWLRIVTAIALVLAVTAAMVQLVNRLGPDDVVREYLEAIVAADAATLRAHRASSTDGETGAEGVSDIALVDEVLTRAAQRVTGYTIESVELSQGQAEVEATLHSELGDSSVTVNLQSADSGPFSTVTWQLQPVALPEIELEVPGGVEQILVNGVALDVSALSERDSSPVHQRVLLSVLPGIYEITLPEPDEGGELIETGEDSVTVPVRLDQWRSPPTAVSYELSSVGEQAAQATIRTELQECVQEATSAQPEQCPVRIDADAEGMDGATGRWEITQLPELLYEHPAGDGWLFSGVLGEAQFITTVIDPGTGEERAETHTAEIDIYVLAMFDEREGFQALMRDRGCGYSVTYDSENGMVRDFVPLDCH